MPPQATTEEVHGQAATWRRCLEQAAVPGTAVGSCINIKIRLSTWLIIGVKSATERGWPETSTREGRTRQGVGGELPESGGPERARAPGQRAPAWKLPAFPVSGSSRVCSPVSSA
jgi:hypothetical protein